LTNTLQVVRELAECAFRGLRQRNAVVRVAHGLVQATNLRGEPVADREASRVVLRAVDAKAGRQALQRSREGRLRGRQVALRVERQHVRVDYLTHGRGLLSSLNVECQTAVIGLSTCDRAAAWPKLCRHARSYRVLNNFL